MAEFSNYRGIQKSYVRKRVNEYIIKGVENPVILTMPADKWIWEKELIKSLPKSYFVGVEKDFYVALTSKEVCINDCNLDAEIHNTSVYKILGQCKRDGRIFNHAILDYCGTINSSYEDIERLLVWNLVVVGGTISITFSKNGFRNRYGHLGTYLEHYPNETGLPDIVYATRGIINKLIKDFGDRYSLEEIIQYYDTSSMMVFILKRNA